ncbi:MAG: helix-turn-helix transcriptional regulator [Acidobacteria bacterium]|nr:helix-turn-helix transcriptional regulator [Acidobacteriota bacterium]MCA1640856.1 helix-turn-helix transcriptional regulator [Acidobacteriota bacterium]
MRAGAKPPPPARTTAASAAPPRYCRSPQRRYALRLLFVIGERGPVRFGDLRGEMDDASTSTLSIRLDELEGAGLVRRRTFNETPPRVEYTLTREGDELRKRLFALSKFAARKLDD